MNRTIINLATGTIHMVALTPEEIAELGQEEAPAEPVKTWPSAGAFMTSFTFGEISAIALSRDPIIVALRFMLSTWHLTVHADDPHVIQGLDALVAGQIITEERRTQIVTP